MKNGLQVIEHDSQRILTTQQIAESYETEARRISENFNANKDRYIRGKHYYCLEGGDLKAFRDLYGNSVVVDRTPRLYLWTEKGAFLHAKSLNTDKAWEVYDALVESYFQKRTSPEIDRLSPQLQLLINMEMNQKKMQQQLDQTDQKLEGIKDIVALNPTQWRKDHQGL